MIVTTGPLNKSSLGNLLVRFTIGESDADGGQREMEYESELVALPEGASMAYAYIACGSDQAGISPARLNLIECSVAAPGGSQWPLLLQYARRAKVQTVGDLPFAPSIGLGMLSHFTLDTWCDRLASTAAHVTSINMELLAYTEVGADKFRVSGLAQPSVSRLIIVADGVAEPTAPHRRAGNGGGEVAWGDVLPKSRAGKRSRLAAPAPPGQAPIAPEPAALADAGGGHGGGEHDDAEAYGMPDFAEELAAIVGDDGMAMVQAAEDLAREFADSDDDVSSSDGEPFDDAGGGSSASGAAASSSSAPAAPIAIGATPPLSAATCWHSLKDVETAAGVQQHLPAFVCSNARWETTIAESGEVLGKVRIIDGRSLRSDCRRLGGKGKRCKIHCDILGRHHRLDAELAKWLVAGSAMSDAEHRALAVEIQDWWRDL